MIYFLKKYSIFLIVILLSFWAIKPLFVPGFFPMHDDTQVARVFEMGNSLKDGMFPVRWVSGLGYGYGYPIFNFYAPLSYYFGGFINVLGANALLATKITFAFGVLMSGLSMFFLAREFWGNIGGLVSATLYVYAPYHAVDVFVRGDLAEVWAYGFVPLVFYGLWKIYKDKKWRYVVVSSLAYSGIILSHNLTALMITPFLLGFIFILGFFLYRNKELDKIYYLLEAFVLGILLVSFYFLPALLEIKFTNVLSQIGGGADFRDHFVCFGQLWISQWGFGGSIPGCIDGMSFMIGKWHIAATAVSAATLFWLRKKSKEKFLVLSFVFMGLFISVLLLLEPSKIVWEKIYPMAFFQYPWRFLLLVSFFTSLASGSVFFWLQTKTQRNKKLKLSLYSFTFFTVLLFIATSSKFFIPQTNTPSPVVGYTSEFAIKWEASKTSDEFMPPGFAKPRNPDEIVRSKLELRDDQIKIKILEDKTQSLTAIVESREETDIKVKKAFFPAWHAYVDQQEVKLRVLSNGTSVSIPAGKHEFKLVYESTFVEKLANFATLSGLVVLVIGIILSTRGAHERQ